MKPIFNLLILIILTHSLSVSAEVLPLMRIAVENPETHVQTIAARRLSDELKGKLRGKIDVQLFPNGELFRDRDVIQALGQGKVEMAFPGTWHLSAYEPDFGIFLLPLFYARPASLIHRMVDGDIGKTLNDRLEKKFQFKVFGRWIDLGYAHLFSVNREIIRYEDLSHLNIRVPVGIGNQLRIEALGGNPVSIAWPDIGEHIILGRINALLTSYQNIEGEKLWNRGINHAFEDQECFFQYVPVVRGSFWMKLPEDVQKIISETWEGLVETLRKQAVDAQIKAKKTCENNKMRVFKPTEKELELWRINLLEHQSEFVRTMDVESDLLNRVTDFFKESP